MKQCKRVPLECVNKCGVKNVPREEVSGNIIKAFYSLRSETPKVTDRSQVSNKYLPSSKKSKRPVVLTAG